MGGLHIDLYTLLVNAATQFTPHWYYCEASLYKLHKGFHPNWEIAYIYEWWFRIAKVWFISCTLKES